MNLPSSARQRIDSFDEDDFLEGTSQRQAKEESSPSGGGAVSSMISYTTSLIPSVPSVSIPFISSSAPPSKDPSSEDDRQIKLTNSDDTADDRVHYQEHTDHDRPKSLEGILSFRKCKSSKDSKFWQHIYVVLNLTNEGSLSLYSLKWGDALIPDSLSKKSKTANFISSTGSTSSGGIARSIENENQGSNDRRQHEQHPQNSSGHSSSHDNHEKEMKPKIFLPPHVNWVAKDIMNNTTGFIIEIDSQQPIYDFIGQPQSSQEIQSQEVLQKQLSLPDDIQDDIKRAHEKNDNFRIYFKCTGKHSKVHEKQIWLRAFEQVGRLDYGLHEPKSIMNRITLSNPNIKMRHSRVRSSHARKLATESKALFDGAVAGISRGLRGSLRYGGGDGSKEAAAIAADANRSIDSDDGSARTGGSSRRGTGNYDEIDPTYQLSRERTKNKSKHAAAEGERGEKEYMVYPLYAYPNRWMTDSELYMEMLKPSEVFHDTRPTSIINSTPDDPTQRKEIGMLKVEVLQCIGLPALDFASETDAVAYMVCGSHAFTTDVIWNRLNPYWLPRSRRACSFPLFHGYARLYVGVFDDDGKGEKDDFAGRVVLDLARCRPKSKYDVTIPLRLSTTVYSRRPRGAIRLRFSLDWYSERAALMSYIPKKIGPPPRLRPDDDVTVLCADEKAFRNIITTVHGIHMPGRFSFSQWKAVMKEATFVQKCLENTIRGLIFDIVTWANWKLTFYIFASWMYTVYKNSFALVPFFFMSFLLLMMIRTYVFYGTDGPIQQGFIPPSWEEMAMSLAKSGKKNEENNVIEPLTVKPNRATAGSRGRLRRGKKGADQDFPHETHAFRGKWIFKLLGFKATKRDKEPNHYHMEFPFSQGLTDPITHETVYPKYGVKESLVLKSSLIKRKGKHTSSDHGVLDDGEIDEFVPPPLSPQNSMKEHLQLPVTVSATASGSADSDTVAPGESELEKKQKFNFETYQLNKSFGMEYSDLPPYLRIPPQDIEAKGQGKKKKLSDELELLKNNMHRLTFHVFHERTHVIRHPKTAYFGQAAKGGLVPRDKVEADLDRLLNVGQFSSANPVVARVGTYVEPILQATFSGLGLYRAIYNIVTWRDPMLSFWVSIVMAAIVVVLAIFPWRFFFFVLGLGLVGPQNYIIRKTEQYGTTPKVIKKRLDKFANKKRKPPVDTMTTELPKDQPVIGCHTSDNSVPATYSPEDVDPRAIHYASIPYSQLMTQRFYDWPPEPQFAKCEPIVEDHGERQVGTNRSLQSSRHARRENRNNTNGLGATSHHARRGLLGSGSTHKRRGLSPKRSLSPRRSPKANNNSRPGRQEQHPEENSLDTNRRGSDEVTPTSVRLRPGRRKTDF